MAIKPSDIRFLLSGGPTNDKTFLSKGGQPSSWSIIGVRNNLFSDISTDVALQGKTDYRCFYISNESTSDSLYEAKIFFEEQGLGGSAANIGLEKSTEIQRINIFTSSFPTTGSMTIGYKGSELQVQWGSSIEQFRANLQTQISSLAPGVVVVSAPPQGNSYNFSVSFSGASNNKNHPLLTASTGDPAVTATVSRVVAGSPIQTIAPLLEIDTVAPARVVFSNPGRDSALTLGNIGPGEKVPVWIRRTTLPNTPFIENDYFNFRIIGRPF